MEYRIGLYNSKLENGLELKTMCNVVYDNIDQVYKHLRKGDILVLNSFVSIFEVESKFLMGMVDEFNLIIEYKDKIGLVGYTNTFTLNVNLALIDLVVEEKELFMKMLELI